MAANAVLDMWRANPQSLDGKNVQQILGFCGDGALRENNPTSQEFREFLANVPSSRLSQFATECLESSFRDGGLALQDIVNQIGTRLGFNVTNGRYRGIRSEPGFDGLWATQDNYSLVVEIKTTDTYRINLDVIAAYRSRLLTQEKLAEDSSSILIVVGRQDTGDLEAQIRGSRHAWDVRLISTDALLRLMSLKENLSDWATSLKINEILKPVEYTRVDPIIDLIFTTGEAATEPSESAEKPDDSPEDVIHAEAFDHAAVRAEAIARLSQHFGKTLVKKGKVFFAASDQSLDLVCLASQPYEQNDQTVYWYGFKPGQRHFLEQSSDGAIALACGGADRILLIPAKEFIGLVEGMNETADTHWHVKVYWRTSGVSLDQPKRGQRADITRYILK